MGMLYTKCPVCGGTKTTKALIMVDGLAGYSGPLAPGSNCPCTHSGTPGWAATGLTEWQAETLAAEVARLTAALAAVTGERDRLREWKDSVLSAVKLIPEFTTGKWGGDKEGWGFVFEIINYLRRDRDRLAAELARLKGEAKS